jgi:D-3-phosphoglycerate dehydrogenase / 2-oxoglutarate reductase
MFVLVNASITPDVAEALARERSWELRPVPQIRAAVSEMPPRQRLSVVAVIIETEPVGDDLIAQLAGLELIACLRSDPVNVDVAAATARGVVVVHTPGRNAEAVADFTLGLCLAAIRNIAVAHHQIVSGDLTSAQPARQEHIAAGDAIWRPADPAAPIPYVVFQGRQLSSLVVGIVGFGAVGRAVARRFAGLVRDIHVADPAVAPHVIKECGYTPTSLPELLPIADVVTVHARSRTIVVGRDELSQMKQGSYLINTARAPVLDYDALMEALDSGHLGGAALDVFPEEPLPTSSPLRKQRGLTLTPHIAGAAAEVTDRQSELLIEAVRGLYGSRSWDQLPVGNPEVRAGWTARAGIGSTDGPSAGEAGARP